MSKMSQQQADLLEASRSLREWLGRLETNLIDQDMGRVRAQLHFDQQGNMPSTVERFCDAVEELFDISQEPKDTDKTPNCS